jgi:hypothetical protein
VLGLLAGEAGAGGMAVGRRECVGDEAAAHKGRGQGTGIREQQATTIRVWGGGW